MRVQKIFPYSEAVKTAGFGWDQGPSEKQMERWTAKAREEARAKWPRVHQGEDEGLPDDLILTEAFKWADWPIINPIDAEYALFVPKDGQGVSCLRLMGPWWEVRVKHMIYAEMNVTLMAHLFSKSAVPAGTPLGCPGNAGLSFGSGVSEGRHVHYSFIAWGAEAEAFFKERLGADWARDDVSSLKAKHGNVVARVITERGIQWMNGKVLRKKTDPFLKIPCYEAALSALIDKEEVDV